MQTEFFDSFKYLTISLVIAVVVLVVVVLTPIRYSMFGRFMSRMPWSSRVAKSLSDSHDSETPMGLLTDLYTKGKITKKEFDAVERDLELYVSGKKSKDEFDVVKHDIELCASEKNPKSRFSLFKKT